MALAMTSPGVTENKAAEEGVLLKQQLRRQRRVEQAKALALIAPLFLFLLAVFVAPITILLARAVDNREVEATLQETAQALKGWPGDALPDEAAFAALVADFKNHPREE